MNGEQWARRAYELTDRSKRWEDLPELERVKLTVIGDVLADQAAEMEALGLFLVGEGQGVIDGKVVSIRVRQIPVDVEATS